MSLIERLPMARIGLACCFLLSPLLATAPVVAQRDPNFTPPGPQVILETEFYTVTKTPMGRACYGGGGQAYRLNVISKAPEGRTRNPLTEPEICYSDNSGKEMKIDRINGSQSCGQPKVWECSGVQ